MYSLLNGFYSKMNDLYTALPFYSLTVTCDTLHYKAMYIGYIVSKCHMSKLKRLQQIYNSMINGTELM